MVFSESALIVLISGIPDAIPSIIRSVKQASESLSRLIKFVKTLKESLVLRVGGKILRVRNKKRR